MIARAAVALFLGMAAAACAPAKPDGPLAVLPLPPDLDCGFHASKDLRRSREERESPPARPPAPCPMRRPSRSAAPSMT
ncbi:hypothetical protein BWQ93_12835 [Sphingopyxis sp. QXT-31]|nr:hypothetical protein BWQ93_12835 [Sphingopyxis sp. QXT-31]